MISNNQIKKLICPYCQSKLRINSVQNRYHCDTLQCGCDIYPVFEGILILKKTVNKVVLNLLEKNKPALAFSKLTSFSFSSKFFFFLTYNLAWLYKKIGFKNFIGIFSLLSCPKGWIIYLKNREKIPSFFFSLLSLGLIKNKNQIIVDLCSGTGNLLPFFYNHVKPHNFIAIDKSFLSLYLAKNFFSQPGTVFICADLDKNLPVISESTDMIHLADGFHYLKQKRLALKEIYRTLKKNGNLAVIHTLNINKFKDKFAIGTNPKNLKKIIKKNGFKKYYLISNELIWKKMISKNKVKLYSYTIPAKSYAYNVFAAKNNILDELTLKKQYLNLLNKTKINFYQDPDLIKIRVFDRKKLKTRSDFIHSMNYEKA